MPTRIAAAERTDKAMDGSGREGQVPGVAEVARVAGLTDPVLRNLLITQCYAELSAALAKRLPGAANWCTFATWASRQAGRTIRGEDLAEAVRHGVDAWLGEGALEGVALAVRALGADASAAELRRTVRDALIAGPALARAGDAVARGNLKVFAEIAHEFARFLEFCGHHESPDPARIEAFVATLAPGDPPAGQQYLRQAFARYYDAIVERDPAVRSERILLANLEVGFHEQTRLQPEIAEAVSAAVLEARDVTPRLLAALLPAGGFLPRVRRFFTRLFGGKTPLDRAVETLVEDAARQVRAAVTEHMMTLQLARTRLRLGHDLEAAFPPALASPRDPLLLALLARVDPTRDSPRESGARDWADLPDRMHFIADMFRCYQETRDLFDPPYSPDQIAAMKAGRRPTGTL
jgi:hypothetical protein